MFFPQKPRRDIPKKEPKPMTPEAKRRMWCTVGLTFLLLFIWYGCMAVGDQQGNPTVIYGVMIAYFTVFAALIITYLAYNRGFVNKDVTEEMLPPEWSPEKKREFVEGNRRRAEKSRWMTMFIIPFLVVFMVEFLYLFLWDGFLAPLMG